MSNDDKCIDCQPGSLLDFRCDKCNHTYKAMFKGACPRCPDNSTKSKLCSECRIERVWGLADMCDKCREKELQNQNSGKHSNLSGTQITGTNLSRTVKVIPSKATDLNQQLKLEC